MLKINKQIVAYASITPYRKGREAVETVAEVSYYVSFDYHRQGIGNALLSKCIENSKLYGIKNILAIVLATNKASMRLLEKNGFELWGRLPKIAIIDNEEVDHLYYGKR